jgi:adenylosuccinate lyase
MLAKAEWLVSGLMVYPGRMLKNLELTNGLVFSGQLLLDLASAGMLREDAYSLVQAHAMRAWTEDGDFREAVSTDPKIRALLTDSQLRESFSISRQLRNIDAIYARVFSVMEQSR